jgi:hypothetical protein
MYAPEASHRAAILPLQINKIRLTEFYLFNKVASQALQATSNLYEAGVLTAIQLLTVRQSREGNLSASSNTKVPSAFSNEFTCG